jgi:hypothetical protein
MEVFSFLTENTPVKLNFKKVQLKAYLFCNSCGLS